MRYLIALILLASSTVAASPPIKEPYFFEIYYCDMPAWVMWATPDVAGSIKANKIPKLKPELRKALAKLRQRAADVGNLKEVRLTGDQCPEA